MPDGALYFEQCYWPFLENDDFDQLPEARRTCGVALPCRRVRWRLAPTVPAAWPRAPAQLRAETDRAIVGLFGGNLLEVGQFLYRNDIFFMLLAGNPRRAHEFLDRLVEIHLANLERFLAAVGPYIDVVSFGDDLGMQNGPQISPAMYREFFKPRHARMWRRAKELADVKVMLHTCGGVRTLLPDLIDAGLDAMNPVQVSCRGMDAAELKAEFGAGWFFGAGAATRGLFCPTAHPPRSPGTSASRCRFSIPAAASFSSRCTTCWQTCRRKTSLRCSMR